MHNSRPLVVDLDGSLIRTDVLVESGLQFLRDNPLQFLRPLLWLRQGRVQLKAQLADRVHIDVSLLPYEPAVLALIRQAREDGREVVLATASHDRYAREIAVHLGVFDRVVATRDSANLKADAKARVLVEAYGEGGFDYVGNSQADVPVWSAAHTAYVVNPEMGVLQRARALGKPVQLLRSRESIFSSLLEAMQLRHWLKNILVLVPLLLGQQPLSPQLFLLGLLAFLCLGLCSSSACLFGDLLNLQRDRARSTGQSGAIASGRLPFRLALSAVPILLLVPLVLAINCLPAMFVSAMLCYYMLALVHTVFLSLPTVIDITVQTLLYTLRLVSGVYVVGSEPGFEVLVFSMCVLFGLGMQRRLQRLASDSPARRQ